ncbi:MAG: type I-F CRISPR-associated helicase Cas3 [Pseudomonadales bacterium]|nr:type I-F CRISPR-associated helicase Cas3 [Pseudomonadales bacterium]
MMVNFVSQCEKKAQARTRRVLDAFADRIGDNVWQTVITEEGLNAVKKLLRKTATKNTAVSCHWIRSRSRSDLLWVVGNKNKFDHQGRVPVNTTNKQIVLMESNWDCLPLIRALAALAALLHDWGKSTRLFQDKLQPGYQGGFGDPIRHEWISCVLLDAFIRHCIAEKKDWLVELSHGNINEDLLEEHVSKTPEKVFSNHDAIAQILMWLIVSHHRLPLPRGSGQQLKDQYLDAEAVSIEECLQKITQAWGYENRKDEAAFSKNVAGCFEFPFGLLKNSSQWLKDVKRWAAKLDALKPQLKLLADNGSIRLVLHHARLCLMLGDHHYSSQAQDPKWQSPVQLFANTDRSTRALKQKLDEHLVGVKKHALDVANLLPMIQRLETEESGAVFDNTALRKPSLGNYVWQQKAVNNIVEFKKKEPIEGAFIVNMASTGCGKTFANAKIMQALSPQGNSLRYVLALGLRTLTLQTGDEYRERVGLKDDELAVLIGSKAVTSLHNAAKKKERDDLPTHEDIGSESLESLLDSDIDFTGLLPEGSLSTVLTDERARKFLYAPVLACTIDHMMSATETKRGGRYILPALRLLSSDLVIDEVDDFTGEDLAAIGRLVHLAGMLGRKVMISSATIPPALAEGFFNAYRKGWQLFSPSQKASSNVCSIWVDEFNVEVIKVRSCNKGIDDYKIKHDEFIKKRINKLATQTARRKVDIIECGFDMEKKSADKITKQLRYFGYIWKAILNKHQWHNTVDEITQKHISFGVVRVANIGPCVDLTKHLLTINLPEDTDIRVMAYHSQQVLLMRHAQEQHLDEVLKRKEAGNQQPNAFSHPIIRAHIDQSAANNIIFILVATPVEEVGRDHDFDWAVVEPSSYRSIIQLAGRVHRHRTGEVLKPNVSLLQYNWKAFEKNDENGRYFVRPGYEADIAKELPSHDLREILDVEPLEARLDASARIQQPVKQQENQLFAAIEHKATKTLLTDYENIRVSNLQGYLQHAWWLTALPQTFQSFRRSAPAVKLFYVWNDKKQRGYWAEKDDDGKPVNRELQRNISTTDLTSEQKVRLWLARDYLVLLEKYATFYELSLTGASLRYGELSLSMCNENDKFEYSPQLGIYKMNKGEKND